MLDNYTCNIEDGEMYILDIINFKIKMHIYYGIKMYVF